MTGPAGYPIVTVEQARAMAAELRVARWKGDVAGLMPPAATEALVSALIAMDDDIAAGIKATETLQARLVELERRAAETEGVTVQRLQNGDIVMGLEVSERNEHSVRREAFPALDALVEGAQRGAAEAFAAFDPAEPVIYEPTGEEIIDVGDTRFYVSPAEDEPCRHEDAVFGPEGWQCPCGAGEQRLFEVRWQGRAEDFWDSAAAINREIAQEAAEQARYLAGRRQKALEAESTDSDEKET